MAAKKAPAKKTAPRRKPSVRKSSDIKDIIGWLDKALKSDKTGAASKGTKGLYKAGTKTQKTTLDVTKSVLGDPKKGWEDVAINTGTMFLPYGKGAKVINKAIKGTSKGKKVVRGTAKVAGAIAASEAYSAGVKKAANSGKRGKRR